ncbi:MAG: hypothetical protein ACJ8DI_17005 [Ktedonobacteraceae bacterium]
MNNWVKGLLIGFGVSIASILVILILSAEKPRRFLQERVQQVQGALPEREQVQQYAQQAATRVSQLAGSAKGTVQQTMKKVKRSGSDLEEKAEQLSPVGN